MFLNLANLIAKNPERLEEADVLYRQAISMRSDYVQVPNIFDGRHTKLAFFTVYKLRDTILEKL